MPCHAAGTDLQPSANWREVAQPKAAELLNVGLDTSQRAMVAARLASGTHGGDRRSDQAANLPLVTQPEAAELLNVGLRSVTQAVMPFSLLMSFS